MQEVIDVNTGEVFVGSGQLTIRAMAIGSCIAIAVFDPKTKIAGMAHIMLAGQAPERFSEIIKYAFDGIEHMLDLMSDAGSSLNDIEVCLVGAGNILRRKDDTICEANIESVTRILKEKNIAVKASVLGGTKRKSVFIDIDNGLVSYTEGDGKEKMLWQLGQA